LSTRLVILRVGFGVGLLSVPSSCWSQAPRQTRVGTTATLVVMMLER